MSDSFGTLNSPLMCIFVHDGLVGAMITYGADHGDAVSDVLIDEGTME
jgi:hypothetical protein